MGRGRPSICPSCGSAKSQSKGYYQRAYGKAKDRKCKDCGRRYTVKIQTPVVTSEEDVPEAEDSLDSSRDDIVL